MCIYLYINAVVCDVWVDVTVCVEVRQLSGSEDELGSSDRVTGAFYLLSPLSSLSDVYKGQWLPTRVLTG